ncbi:MAG: hypothetical protein ABI442_15040 [Gemmatimonadaceae bacterium]
MTRSFTRTTQLVAAAALAAACSKQQEAPKVPLATAATTMSNANADSAKAIQAAHALIGPAAKAALDSGNKLFRKKAYDGALAQYRAASELAPQHSAPLFGIYMVGKATNNNGMADSALAGIRARSGSTASVPQHGMSDSALKKMHDEMKKRPAAG